MGLCSEWFQFFETLVVVLEEVYQNSGGSAAPVVVSPLCSPLIGFCLFGFFFFALAISTSLLSCLSFLSSRLFSLFFLLFLLIFRYSASLVFLLLLLILFNWPLLVIFFFISQSYNIALCRLLFFLCTLGPSWSFVRAAAAKARPAAAAVAHGHRPARSAAASPAEVRRPTATAQ